MAVLAPLLVLLLLTSCSGIGSRSTPKGPVPVITPKQASRVIYRLETERVHAITTQDPSSLSAIDTDPQLTLDRNEIQREKVDATAPSPSLYHSVGAAVPKQTTYPAWFVGAGVVQGGDAIAVDFFTRASSRVPWRLKVETMFRSGSFRWKTIRGGWVIPDPSSIDASRLMSQYWNAAMDGGDTGGVAPGSLTSGIGDEERSALQTNESNGWAQAVMFAAGGELDEAIKLTDGSDLVFAWVTETIYTRQAYGGCIAQPFPDGSKWDPLVPNGNYLEIDRTYTDLEGMAAPPHGDLRGLSYAGGISSLTTAPCTT